MQEILMQTYTIALPIVLGYIVWLLQNQKKSRDANSRGTMLLLRVQLIEYHSKYTKRGNIPATHMKFNEMIQCLSWFRWQWNGNSHERRNRSVTF